MYTKSITIGSDIYEVRFSNDLYSPVPVGEVITLTISRNGVDLYSPDVINTNNLFKDITSYLGPNNNLSVILYTKKYNLSFGRYDLTEIPQDLRITSDFYQYATQNLDGSIQIFPIKNYLQTTDGKSTRTNLPISTTFSLKIDFNLYLQLQDSSPDNVMTIDFITDVGSTQVELNTNFSNYGNNPLFKMNHLENAEDIKSVLYNSNLFNYKFTPVKINSSGAVEQETDTNGNPIVLQHDINKQIEDLYIAQYLSEYVRYFEALNTDNEMYGRDSDLLTATKLSLISHANIVNSFFKGTRIGIEIIFGLFCKNLGRFIFKVEQSPVAPNFVYRLTSDIPKVYWDSVIKDIVHPVGWADEFVFINMNSEYPSTNLEDYFDKFNPFVYNNRNYYIQTRRHILLLRSLPKTYLDVHNDPPYNTDTRIYDSSIVENMHSNTKFNFKPAEYNTELELDVPELLAELDAPENIELSYTRDDAKGVFWTTTEYKLNGVALEYELIVSQNDVIKFRFTSFSPRTSFEFPIINSGDIVVQYVLKNQNFAHSVYKTFTLS
jgi:hypothetical protein